MESHGNREQTIRPHHTRMIGPDSASPCQRTENTPCRWLTFCNTRRSRASLFDRKSNVNTNRIGHSRRRHEVQNLGYGVAISADKSTIAVAAQYASPSTESERCLRSSANVQLMFGNTNAYDEIQQEVLINLVSVERLPSH